MAINMFILINVPLVSSNNHFGPFLRVPRVSVKAGSVGTFGVTKGQDKDPSNY